jgi:hypothetical protein
MLVNLKSGRVINQVMKGGSIGYLIDSKFYPLTRLRECLEEVTNEDQPF